MANHLGFWVLGPRFESVQGYHFFFKMEIVIKKEVIILVILIIVSNFFLFLLISKDYNQKIIELNTTIDSLDEKINTQTKSLAQQIEKEKTYSEQQRRVLENTTLENFKILENFINQKTKSLQLDLESQLSEVETKVGGLEEKSSELEEKLSEIQVESKDFTEIIEDVIKAVVSIQTDIGQASGTIYDQRGYIITNWHVIEDASAIAVIDYDSKSYQVRIVGTAQDIDLAVLKIESDDDFHYLDFEDDVSIGERVIAVGNPFGLSFSVTEGIISALNREIDDTRIGYIQTDVPINPGNSGGPLVNTDKKIVGINTLKISGENLGFAIPAAVAEDIAQQALEADS